MEARISERSVMVAHVNSNQMVTHSKYFSFGCSWSRFDS